MDDVARLVRRPQDKLPHPSRRCANDCYGVKGGAERCQPSRDGREQYQTEEHQRDHREVRSVRKRRERRLTAEHNFVERPYGITDAINHTGRSKACPCLAVPADSPHGGIQTRGASDERGDHRREIGKRDSSEGTGRQDGDAEREGHRVAREGGAGPNELPSPHGVINHRPDLRRGAFPVAIAIWNKLLRPVRVLGATLLDLFSPARRRGWPRLATDALSRKVGTELICGNANEIRMLHRQASE